MDLQNNVRSVLPGSDEHPDRNYHRKLFAKAGVVDLKVSRLGFVWSRSASFPVLLGGFGIR